MRQSRGSSAPNVPSPPRASPQPCWPSAPSAGRLNWSETVTPRRWPPSKPAIRWAQRLAGPPYLVARIRALLAQSLLRLGQAGRADQFLASLGEQDRERGEICVATAELRLARGDPQAALTALAPVQEHPVSEDYWGSWLARADVLEAIAWDAPGDPDAADAAIERALDLSEPSGDLTPFLLYPACGLLLERHARQRTVHAALVAEIRGLLARPGGDGGMASPRERGGLGGSPPG
jgi:hypothetical protein